jgi:hypothetical protein
MTRKAFPQLAGKLGASARESPAAAAAKAPFDCLGPRLCADEFKDFRRKGE